jgi:hypothetical protein
MRTWNEATAGGPSPGRSETAEQLLDAVEARAQHGLRRNLRNVRAEARGLLEGEFVRRRPWVAIGLTTAVGVAAGVVAVRVLRSPLRAARFAGRAFSVVTGGATGPVARAGWATLPWLGAIRAVAGHWRSHDGPG